MAELTPEQAADVAYTVAYALTKEGLKAGLHPDAIKLSLAFYEQHAIAEGITPEQNAAKWEGFQDAVDGKPQRTPRGS
jgi:hypothetical protein